MRILSAKDCGGKIQIVRATLRMAKDHPAVDSFSQGGAFAAVDLESGMLGKCFLKNPTRALARHPNTLQLVEGESVPLWKEVKAIVQKAHQAARDFNFLGWDVAVSDHGVLVTECNVWSEVDVVQIPQDTGLLDDDFLRLLRLEFPEEKNQRMMNL
jgi:hypothetical protein